MKLFHSSRTVLCGTHKLVKFYTVLCGTHDLNTSPKLWDKQNQPYYILNVKNESFCWWSFFIPAALSWVVHTSLWNFTLSCVIRTSLIQVRNCEINRINLIALDWKLFLKRRKFRNMRLLVCVTEQNYVSIFFTRLWSVRNSIYYLGTKVDWWLTIKNVILFSLRFIFTCRLVLYLCACEDEILKFYDSVYLKSKHYCTSYWKFNR